MFPSKKPLQVLAVAAYLAISSATAMGGQSTFVLSDGTGEWFTPVGAAFFSKESMQGRYLVIQARVTNTAADEVIENVTCFAKLELNFANGKKAVINSEDICGPVGIAAAAAKIGEVLPRGNLIIGPNETHVIDTTEGGSIMSTLRGPTVPGKYGPYPIDSVNLTIRISGQTPFGDQISQTVLDTPIPAPSHTQKFGF